MDGVQGLSSRGSFERIPALHRLPWYEGDGGKPPDEAASLALLIRGSSFQRFSTCSRPQCACHQGQRRGPRTDGVVTAEKAQKQHYVPQEQVQAVEQGIGQHRRLSEIVFEVTPHQLGTDEKERSQAKRINGSYQESAGRRQTPAGETARQRQKGDL